jgi:hypothetical protein
MRGKWGMGKRPWRPLPIASVLPLDGSGRFNALCSGRHPLLAMRFNDWSRLGRVWKLSCRVDVTVA